MWLWRKNVGNQIKKSNKIIYILVILIVRLSIGYVLIIKNGKIIKQEEGETKAATTNGSNSYITTEQHLSELSFINDAMELVAFDKNLKQTSLTSTVPEGITEGIFIGIVSSGYTFKNIPTVLGNGIATSETLFEVNQTGGAGVMLGVKVLKCTFIPNETITTSGDNISTSSASIVNLIFGK